MTYLQAALTILAHADQPLTLPELTSAAIAHRLIQPRGRTPDRSMSSVLYRRLVADPDAPIVVEDGRFWLRDRPRPSAHPAALRPHARRARRERGTADRRHDAQSRRVTVLPEPPVIDLPFGAFAPAETGFGHSRERAAGRLAAKLQSLAAKRPIPETLAEWDAARSQRALVAPALTALGYRRTDQRTQPAPRGRIATLLLAGDDTSLLLDTLRAAHPLSDGDARSTLARAAQFGATWAVTTNGRELRLYAAHLANAATDPSGALVFRADLAGWSDDHALDDTAQILWLLSRVAVAGGALDSYLAARAVGAALLRSLEDSSSPLVRAAVEAVASSTGLHMSPALVARQARLALRNPRGRDGEPLPAGIPSVAAVTGPASLQRPAQQDATHTLAS